MNSRCQLGAKVKSLFVLSGLNACRGLALRAVAEQAMVFEQHSILQRKLAEDARKRQAEEEERRKKEAEEKQRMQKEDQKADQKDDQKKALPIIMWMGHALT